MIPQMAVVADLTRREDWLSLNDPDCCVPPPNYTHTNDCKTNGHNSGSECQNCHQVQCQNKGMFKHGTRRLSAARVKGERHASGCTVTSMKRRVAPGSIAGPEACTGHKKRSNLVGKPDNLEQSGPASTILLHQTHRDNTPPPPPTHTLSEETRTTRYPLWTQRQRVVQKLCGHRTPNCLIRRVRGVHYVSLNGGVGEGRQVRQETSRQESRHTNTIARCTHPHTHTPTHTHTHTHTPTPTPTHTHTHTPWDLQNKNRARKAVKENSSGAAGQP